MIVAHLASLLLFLLPAGAATPPPNYETLDLPAVIAALPELSHIHAQLQRDPASNASLAGLHNVTVFLGKGHYPTNLNYTIVNGIYPESSFSTNKTFLHTHLTNPKYANVTGGQVLEVQKRPRDGATTVVGGVRGNRIVVANIIKPNINFGGGLLHILDTPVPPPAPALETAHALNLTALTSASASKIIALDQHLHDTTRVFVEGGKGLAYLLSLVPKLSPQQTERLEDGNLVSGEVVYSSLFGEGRGRNVTSANEEGDRLNFLREGEVYKVNGARVTRADVLVANGVLHGLGSPALPLGYVPPIPLPSFP